MYFIMPRLEIFSFLCAVTGKVPDVADVVQVNQFLDSKMKILIFILSIAFADDGHNPQCKDWEVGQKCELDCEAVNKVNHHQIFLAV